MPQRNHILSSLEQHFLQLLAFRLIPPLFKSCGSQVSIWSRHLIQRVRQASGSLRACLKCWKTQHSEHSSLKSNKSRDKCTNSKGGFHRMIIIGFYGIKRAKIPPRGSHLVKTQARVQSWLLCLKGPCSTWEVIWILYALSLLTSSDFWGH